MKVLTNSINKYIKDTFKKESEDLLLSEILLVEYLTIDGMDLKNNKQKVSFEDLKIFKNLKYLELRSVTITNGLIKILENLEYLESIIFRDCKFSIKNMNSLINIKTIRIINCKNFNPLYIEKLLDLERLYISDETIKDLKPFDKLNLQSLDLSGSDLKKAKGLSDITVKYLVISDKQYNDFTDDISNLNMRIMVMANPELGYYIKKWIN